MRRSIVLSLCLLLAACAEPPSKEMNQAQGAIDAARAAGANRYAIAELTAATTALKAADEAVVARDYRLALSHAIDSREKAQIAARSAGDGRAKARGDAERLVASVETLLAQLNERLAAAESATRRVSPEVKKLAATARAAMQEARTALGAEEYVRATTAADGLAEPLEAALAGLDATPAPPPARRRR